ncbi:type II toxin-antitoxin system VapC family toxin [Candidatus Parabeggiatoa sp. HSG14]|uniref:type II toxin-antitoxin system VapC family toxin n=1 Tax=Candidatus Parabeggiatoa sp. HSG14 TaxID=3055593 RepID=UPI0025A8A84A|nr:type II toxin-antitoxin system VapC family toxin [Thiotrichales bacterium HSG14]
MILFFDTSALVKYFHVEEGTERVTALINDSNNEIWILELARIEFISALFRKYRAHIINDNQLESAIEGFEAEYSTFNVEPLSQPAAFEAEYLLKKYGKTEGLRTLDALHFAAFRLLAEEGWYFVAADEVLCHTVQLEGFNVINPCRNSF